MLFSSYLPVLPLMFGFAASAAIEPRQVPDTRVCEVTQSGYLAANATGVWKAFTLNSANEVAYTGDGQNKLQVDLMTCHPEGVTPGDEYEAYFWVPSKKLCVQIVNQSDPKPPYYPQLAKCQFDYGPEPPFRWIYRSGDIHWAGTTGLDWSNGQGICGLFGYNSHDKGVPTVRRNNQIVLGCHGASTPFRVRASAS